VPVASSATAIRYDACLSFATEQRPYAEQVAAVLRARGLRVFYDHVETHERWDRDLLAHLDVIYRERSGRRVLFISADYARKAWANRERRGAQARALRAGDSYLLPVRCDDTEIPGVPEPAGCLDARRLPPEALAHELLRALGPAGPQSRPPRPGGDPVP
jgi:hypothetical protein